MKSFFSRLSAAFNAFTHGSNVIVNTVQNNVTVKQVPTGYTEPKKTKTSVVGFVGFLTLDQALHINCKFLLRQLLWSATSPLMMAAFKSFLAIGKNPENDFARKMHSSNMRKLAGIMIARKDQENPVDLSEEKNIWLVSFLAPKLLNERAAAVYAEMNGCEAQQLIDESKARRASAMRGLNEVLRDFLTECEHNLESYVNVLDDTDEEGHTTDGKSWLYSTGQGREIQIAAGKLQEAANKTTLWLGEQNPEFSLPELMLLQDDMKRMDGFIKQNIAKSEGEAPDYVASLDDELLGEMGMAQAANSGK